MGSEYRCEASLALPLLISCCAVQFLTDRGGGGWLGASDVRDKKEGDADARSSISGLSNRIDSGSANYLLQCKSIPLPVFVNMVSWAHSCAPLFTYCGPCIHPTRFAAPGAGGSAFH